MGARTTGGNSLAEEDPWRAGAPRVGVRRGVEESADGSLVVGTPARRIGWACRCGETLPGGLACSCGDAYVEDFGVLVLRT